MKLHYWQSPNFGDALNAWLWPKLLPNFFDEDETEILVGIGTLLNNYLPQEPRKIIFGSGVGYGAGVPVVDDRWRVYCVRGPLSARALHLSDDVAITDPAVLVRRFCQPATEKVFPVSFIPHWESMGFWDWQTLCESVGIHFIDPLRPVEMTIADIACSEMLIAEAMHGAIVADALRVPWVAVAIYDQILPFKWHDWCGSMGIQYQPINLPRLVSARRALVQRLEELRCCRVRRLFPYLMLKEDFRSRALLLAATRICELGRRESDRQAVADTACRLKTIATCTRRTLSERNRLETATERLEQQLERLRMDRVRCQL